MSDPWFAENLAWIPGTVLGSLAGVWGGLVGMLGPKGASKKIVFGLYWLLLISGVASLALGISALVMGQPYGVWYGFLLAGFIIVLAVGINGFTMKNVYRQAEVRRMEAEDL